MVSVTSLGLDRLRIAVRGHALFADQPVEDGGEDTAPTPTEIFAGSLAACVAYYAERFLRRHGLSVKGLTVSCDYSWAENPHRVGQIELTIDAPDLPVEKRIAFSRVVEHCTIHETLLHPPVVRTRIRTKDTAAV